jgi:hypothetical protein
MLILDKQKAVERVMALTSGVTEATPEPSAVRAHVRTYQRIATFERRAQAAAPLRRSIERRRRRRRLIGDPSPA